MPLPKKEESALESLEHQLYDPKAKIDGSEIHRTREHRALDLPTSWGEDAPIIVKREEDTRFSFGTKLLLVSTVLLVIALAFTAWRVISLRNVVSAVNIDMTADITPYVEGGESTPLILTLRNRNTSELQSASVTILYKQGNGSQDEQEKIQEKRDLGTIKTGEYKKQDFVVALYGAESETRDIVLKLEYKVAGSNAVFSKLVTASVILRTPPISVNIEGPGVLSVGQNGTYSFVIKNNSATSSLPSILQVTFPNSFTVESETPKPISRSKAWQIRPLTPGEQEIVTVVGSFTGKQGELGTLQAKIGSRGDNHSTIGIVYSSQTTDVTLRSSPLTVTTSLGSNSGVGESLKYGDSATLTITYRNTSSQVLEDVAIKLALSGDAAIYGQINPTSGYYDSIQKTITWDKATFPDLAVLAPNSEATLIVIVPIVDKGTNSPTLKTVLTGSASTKITDDIVATFSKTWVVEGSASLVAKTQYKTSSFQNSGPIPPQPNQETTYTVNLTVAAQNALTGTRVSFVLPAYVSWRGVSSDINLITYDTRTRTVSWNIGVLAAGKIISSEIGLSVKPSQSHVGQTPAITSGVILDADEEISRAHIRTTLSPLTTLVRNETWPENPSVVVDRP